jgi:hypothetical protein
MAWGNKISSNVVSNSKDATTSEELTMPAIPTIRFQPFDATKHEPMVRPDILPLLVKAAEETEWEKKKRVAWTIADNRLLNESARVQALKLIHQIQVDEDIRETLEVKVRELEAKLAEFLMSEA